MRSERILPIKQIKKGSRVVLYGAGKNGRRYWEQNEKLGWCDIVLVVDRHNGYESDFGPWIDSAERIADVDYDFILVSVVNPGMREEVVSVLLDMGASEEKIISAIDEFYLWDAVEDTQDAEDQRTDDDVFIAFLAVGAMGDSIISLKLYQEIVRLCGRRCRIDVYAGDETSLGHTYYGQECLRKIWQGFELKMKYDAAIELRFEPRIRSWDKKKVQRIAPDLVKALAALEQYQKKDYVDGSCYQYDNRVLVDRARFLGLNRYTLFGISGAFEIKDQKVDFFIDDKYRPDFEGLGLTGPYVTYNFGAKDQFGDGKRQTKMWPYEYHEKFNEIFKSEYPGVQLIQLGGSSVEKIPGADRYLLGCNLEVVKYILQGSLIHFDCEGGLVHMATQLGTKCCVVFGPTPAWFMGYPQNINLLPEKCGECKGLIKDWYTRCIKYGRPECMYSITPERAVSAVGRYLDTALDGKE